ncbi:MAG: ABC transporter ATP-binding protein [Planctomycetota bacterium]|nr:ABC transporter ATP-binding protein [Planctomycetota bacterium]
MTAAATSPASPSSVGRAAAPTPSAPAPDPVAIHCENLGKVYHMYARPADRLKQALWRWRRTFHKEFWALKGVSFDVRRGETVGILGRNGAGKSTLLQIIAGVLAPSTGQARVQGRVVPLLELGSGFSAEFTGRENVFLYGQLLGLSPDFLREKFDEIARFADIGEFIDQPLKTYSSGMHARLAFSVAAFVKPDVLIVDEILAVGDAAFKAKSGRVFHRLRDEGCTILLVAHDPYLIKTFCQRALYLRKGEQAAFGEASMVADKYQQEIDAAQVRDGTIEVRGSSKGGAGKENDDGHNLTGLGLFAIPKVELLSDSGELLTQVRTGQTVRLRFHYRTLRPGAADRVTFVFSLYRHDGLYICGNTTLMDKLPPFSPGKEGVVEITFPNLRLLAGSYVWRVAIDDDRAFGIYVEACNACPFQVVDGLEAVGMFNLERVWAVQPSA